MEPNGMYLNMGSGLLGLEMSLHHVLPQQNPHPIAAQNHPRLDPQLSDEDDPGGPTADQNSADDGKRKTRSWQRMKWTDNMVRLLIMVVYYIGDEVGSEGNSTDPAAGNKKKAGAGAGVLQKKGKWKSVSRAMMERGFYVSPQQCEDKFNDLNKSCNVSFSIAITPPYASSTPLETCAAAKVEVSEGGRDSVTSSFSSLLNNSSNSLNSSTCNDVLRPGPSTSRGLRRGARILSHCTLTFSRQLGEVIASHRVAGAENLSGFFLSVKIFQCDEIKEKDEPSYVKFGNENESERVIRRYQVARV
nr:lateral signaling target protein 2 homolog [Ipomoea batatas]